MRILLTVLASASVLAVACIYGDPGTMVHAEPGSRIDSIVFHAFVFPDSIHPNQGLVSLAVYQCGDTTHRALWAIERTSQGVRGAFHRTAIPLFIRYGELPAPEWVQRQAASSLQAGCYSVRTVGGGIGAQRQFYVQADGVITQKQ
jgi:hypothetical protein